MRMRSVAILAAAAALIFAPRALAENRQVAVVP